MARLAPCLGYLGAKTRMAPRIVDLLGEHKAYLEPYVGSAAVLLAKEESPVEIINDANSQLIEFYRVLRNKETRYELIDALTYTPYARKELEECLCDSLDDSPVERARKFMVRTNQRYGNTGGWLITKKGTSGHTNATKWRNYVTRLSIVSERLSAVQIECRDAHELLRDVLESHNRSDLATYIDPPYLAHTRNGSKYDCDFGEYEASIEHHKKMLDKAKWLCGPVVISGYDDDLYEEMLDGWHKIELNVQASGNPKRSKSGEAVARRTEVLWCNRHCTIPDNFQPPALVA